MIARGLLIAAALVMTAAPVMAQNASHPSRNARLFTQPIGPIGLDTAPPSPLCRASLGASRHIHCLHNIVWHGGKTYFIDDLQDPPVCNDCTIDFSKMRRR